MRFILEIKSNKLHLQLGETFKDLVKGCKFRSAETQTMVKDKEFNEMELQEMFRGSYSGEISVDHFVENPEDLGLFITDYHTLINTYNKGRGK